MSSARVTVASYSAPKTLKAAIAGAKMESPSEEPWSSAIGLLNLTIPRPPARTWASIFLSDC